MTLLLRHRMFADHYQFYVFDSDSGPCSVTEQWSSEAVKRGYLVGRHAIHVGTKAHLNDHRVDLYLSHSPATRDGAEVFHELSIDLSSGKVRLSSPAYIDTDEPEAILPPGPYEVFIRGFNLGVETEDELEDDEYLARSDLD